MRDFSKFRDAVNAQFSFMAEQGELLYVDTDKDELWNLYLSSFPEGSNPIFRERTEHDCNCCKGFIRRCGAVVMINANYELVSIWDVEVDEPYATVAKAMSDLVKSRRVISQFLHYESRLGLKHNHMEKDDGSIIKWDHFYFNLPSHLWDDDDVERNKVKGESIASHHVLERGVNELSFDSMDIILEVIDQNSLYRGSEYRTSIEAIRQFKKEYFKQETREQKELCLWALTLKYGAGVRIKNTAIGTLLEDISNGMDLEEAIKRFEKKVAPENYKRPSAVVTQSMIKKAQEKIESLGVMESLPRRYSVIDDITINNVLWANRDAKKAMNVFDEMAKEAPANMKKLGKVEEVTVDTFLNNILPKASSIEVYMENRLTGNLVTLLSPENPNAPGIFKWGNNFSWSYNGEFADSIKEQVKSLGGKVDGVARFSLIWNQKGKDSGIDFDAHCREPRGGKHIYFDNQKVTHPSSGRLDVDNTHPGENPGIENIAYSDIRKIRKGVHVFQVHNYSRKGSKEGFVAELEINGEIHVFEHARPLKGREWVDIAEVEFNKETGQFKILKSLKSTETPQKIWNMTTVQFQKVDVIMNSPNHWDGECTGNRHLFFVLEDCVHPGTARGFYNEFLDEKFREHRKVFEILGSKMRAQESDNQLSGLGFSSTVRNSVICKVEGSFSRTVRVMF